MNPRKLWIYYTAAITTVLALLFSGHAFHIRVLAHGAQDAETINVSGRQRMLSQRVLLAATKFADGGDPIYASTLTSSLDTMAQGHRWLLEHAVNSATAHEHYLAPNGVQLDFRTLEYIELGRSLLTEANGRSTEQTLDLLVRMEAIALDDLLRDLNTAVQIFEAEANGRAEKLEMFQKFALFAAIGILLLEAAFIFRPAHRVVVRALDTAEAQNRDLQDLASRLEFSAFHDPLTGLANRKRLHIELSARLDGLKEGDETICVMHLDLDGFKGINDTLGHASGDEVLKRVAAILLASVPKGGTVARVGGDEFVVVLEGAKCDAETQARFVSDAILDAVRQPMTLGEEKRVVGVSIGYTFASDHGTPGDVLIANADIALYAAKSAGKGTAKGFDAQMRAELEHREYMLQQLRLAVFSQEFAPFYQPKVSLDSGQVVGFEVLARWKHPKMGILTPDRFIEEAESAGLMDAIEGQLLFAALEDFQDFVEMSNARPNLAFNATLSTLQDGTLAGNMLSIVTSFDLEPADIIFEIVESVTFDGEHSEKIFENIANLRKAGFGVHIDDFGTGYASLENIARLDVTGLKLDKSIISSINDPKYQQIAQAVSGLASTAEIELVAEGVETQEQAFMLRDMGFDTIQGFLFARPMSKNDCLAWLRARKDLRWITRQA